MKTKLIILGKTPPPVGGVTIYTKRLLEALDRSSIDYKFIYASINNIIRISLKCITHRCIIHLNVSSVYLHIYFVILKIINRKITLIISYHGNIGRYGYIRNAFDKISIKIADYPIVLNLESLKKARVINKKTNMISAFMSPNYLEDLSPEIKSEIQRVKNRYEIIFCTNAYNLAYDKEGNEIYGGTQLVRIFSQKQNRMYCLIFSDPSGKYREHFAKMNIDIPDNILLINGQHSFFEILKMSDCLIRNTITDGDSISIKEAMYLNKIVFASNVIIRPQGVCTYNWGNEDELQELIDRIHKIKMVGKNYQIEDGSEKIISLYRRIIQDETNSPRC